MQSLQSASAGAADAAALEALAEVRFRLALLPRTPNADALRYLQDARRIDGANPRYAYHLARLCFGYGDLDGAARWLREAVRLCPTSHRLWAHVSLLQHELQEGYRSKTEYEPDGLKLRAEAIAKAIRSGNDVFAADLIEFVPPRSRAALEEEARKRAERGEGGPVPKVDAAARTSATAPALPSAKRLTNPGVVRWTGINDLEIERLLEGEPSQRVRDRLLPVLDQVIASKRTATGATGFVILAVQWLCAGYPVATIRRLLPQLKGQTDDPSISLLHEVCSLFDEAPESLPHALANAIAQRRLPPLLAALIHNKRLLWRSVDFAATGAYSKARRLLAAASPTPSDSRKSPGSSRRWSKRRRRSIRPPPNRWRTPWRRRQTMR